MKPAVDLEPILENGEWRQWRTAQHGAAELAAAARAWCRSPHWKQHTPALEDWKLVVADLGRQGLAEAELMEMSAEDGQGLPFPAIPLFESEQFQDLCRIAMDPETAAALVERVEAQGALLTVDTCSAADEGWAALGPAAKRGLTQGVWRWMLPESASGQIPLPAAAEATYLMGGLSPGRAEPVRLRLRAAVEARIQDAGATGRPSPDLELEGALEIADALWLWRDPDFMESALGVFVNAGGPSALRLRLELACAKGEARLPDDPALMAHLRDNGFPLPDGTGTAERDARLLRQLVASNPDLEEWGAVETEVQGRQPGAPRPHPLAGMANLLGRALDFPVDGEAMVWGKLREMLRKYPGLLDVDHARPGDALPALRLAASVRSATSVGEVALGILDLSPRGRRDPVWWRALWAGLGPSIRRRGTGNAGDRRDAAIELVRMYAARLGAAEGSAMQRGFSGEDVHGRK